MIGVVWNAHGMGGQRAFCDTQRLVREMNPDFLFISESKIRNYAACCLKSYLKFDYVFSIDPIGSKGGLILLWLESMKISIFSYSIGHIDCLIEDNSKSFYFTGFCGNSNTSDHHLSWKLLDKIASTHTNSQFGWLVGEDFNEILFDHEKKEVSNAPSLLSIILGKPCPLTPFLVSRLVAQNLRGIISENLQIRFWRSLTVL